MIIKQVYVDLLILAALNQGRRLIFRQQHPITCQRVRITHGCRNSIVVVF